MDDHPSRQRELRYLSDGRTILAPWSQHHSKWHYRCSFNPFGTPGYIALRCLFDLTYYLRSWSPKLTLATKVCIVNMGASQGGLSQPICQVKLTGVWIYSHLTCMLPIGWVVADTHWVGHSGGLVLTIRWVCVEPDLILPCTGTWRGSTSVRGH